MEALSRFNQQILRYQDEAYTLACYLLGNETQAEQVTQAAVAAAFQLCPKESKSCRLLLLRQVCRLCRLGKVGKRLPAGQVISGLPWKFNSFAIATHERMVLVLVDVLDLSYRETAAVLGLPVENIGRLLACARRKLGGPETV